VRTIVPGTERFAPVAVERSVGALPFDPEQIALIGPLDHEPLGRAGEEVGDDRVDGDPPAGDRDSGLPGRDEDGPQTALLRLAVELERDGHLPDRAVGADGEHDPGVELQVLAGRDVEAVRGLAQVVQLDLVARGKLNELGILGQELV